MESPSRALVFSLADSPAYVRVRHVEEVRAIPLDAEVLSFEGLELKDAELKGLPVFLHLRALDLDGTQISDEALDWVAKQSNLEELWVECTGVTDSGLLKLASLRRLRFISVAYTEVTETGAEALRACLPSLKVSV
jgi:hypothetical protein